MDNLEQNLLNTIQECSEIMEESNYLAAFENTCKLVTNFIKQNNIQCEYNVYSEPKNVIGIEVTNLKDAKDILLHLSVDTERDEDTKQ